MFSCVRFSFIAGLLATAACSQSPAHVDLKGQHSYGRASTHSYASNSSPTPYYQMAAVIHQPKPTYSDSANTVQTASIEAIGVSDLAPAAGPTTKPLAKPAPKQVAENNTKAAPVNLWTRKPRTSEDGEPVEQLDRIIGDSSDKALAPEAPKKVVKVASSGFIWPVATRKLISSFGPKGGGKVNDGINIASSEGEPVWAAGDGEVVYVGNELKGYGNMVLIKHNASKTTTYAHLNRATVDKYDRVKQGDIIGYVGSTGNVKASQLHFSIRDGKDPVDPKKFLSRNVASLD